MQKRKYDVAFNFNVLFPPNRIAGKKGKIEIETNGGELDIDAVQKDKSLIAMIAQDVQGHYKRGKIFSLNITGIEKIN